MPKEDRTESITVLVGVQNDIEALIGRSGAEAVAVGYCDLTSNARFFILPDYPFHAASTMKVCVLMELFHQAGLGQVALDELIAVRNEFASIVDRTLYSIGQKDDSEQSLYSRIGESISLMDLANPMIVHSSNLATNLLVDRLGAASISEFMGSLGAPGLKVLRGVEDGKAYRQGLNNSVTALGLTTIMAKLGLGEVVSRESSDAMIEILAYQAHRQSIPAGLPAGTRVANKTGWNDGICHDTGIVYPPNRPPYVLTVLTRGLATKEAGQELIAGISRMVFNSKVEQRTQVDGKADGSPEGASLK